MTRGYSSVGRALQWHCRGQRFEPAYLHRYFARIFIANGIDKIHTLSNETALPDEGGDSVATTVVIHTVMNNDYG